MAETKRSDVFRINRFFWKIFALWPGKHPTKCYKYYSVVFLIIVNVVYNLLLSVNLFCTPHNVQAFIEEALFFFTELAAMTKMIMIITKREKIIALFKIINCKEFQGRNQVDKTIIANSDSKYKICWKLYALTSNFSYFGIVFIPVILHFVFKTDLKLPIAKYYFLSDATKENYFILLFIYQSIGIYVHMTYNVNIDSFMAGMIFVGVSELKILNHNFSQLNLRTVKNKNKAIAENMKMMELNKLLLHYDLIIRYCFELQETISMVMFVQYCMASIIVCLAMCGLLMVSTSSGIYGLFSYVLLMTLQIFVPAWMGTQLSFESQDLGHAAYCSDWIPQSEPYKRSIRLFISRTNIPIVITALKMFPLLLGTFISIMKMAYSFFALIRKLQDRPV